MILCANPREQYLAHKSDIDSAIKSALENGRYVQGDNCRQFETEFANYCGATFGIGVGSGTEALHVALKAVGVGTGDEVITVSHTAVATVAAIELAGGTPVFVDIDPITFTINVSEIEKAITPKTKAIVPVHIYGQSVDLTPLMQLAKSKNIFVIEDCAQAHGARYDGKRVGSYGDMACFSFYPTKNLGALGDGGMVVTSSAALAEKAKLLREYGWKERYISECPGWNSRLDELQAAVLIAKLKHLDNDTQKRNKLAQIYAEGLKELPLTLPQTRKNSSHVYHLFVIRTKERDALQAFLQEKGIHTLVHYPIPIHAQPAYKGRLKSGRPLIETDTAAQEILSLPLYPELNVSDVQLVIDNIKQFFVTASSRRKSA